MNPQCSSYCVSESFNLLAISEYLSNCQTPHKIYDRDVLHVDHELPDLEQKGDIFIYSYGCIVFWGFNALSEEKVVNKLKEFGANHLDHPIIDRCTYSIPTAENISALIPQGEGAAIDGENDQIYLAGKDPYVMLSLSYGLSQSVKLSALEESIAKTIEENRDIPLKLIATGKISLSRAELARKIGALFAERNFVNLNSAILDTPDFFWKRPRYEPYYDMSVKFMDIKQRITILNHRLNVIHELYGMLSTELKHLHSSRLELIIIYLIMIEVLFILLRDVLHWI